MPTIPPIAPPLSAEHERILAVLLDLLIPSSADGRMPGAAQLDFSGYARQAGIAVGMADGLQALDQAARQQHGAPFCALAAERQGLLVAAMRRPLFRFFGELANHVMIWYYQHDKVLAGLGMEARAPFPLGYFPIDGDLTLLEAVFERAPFYRQP